MASSQPLFSGGSDFRPEGDQRLSGTDPGSYIVGNDEWVDQNVGAREVDVGTERAESPKPPSVCLV